MLAFGPAKVVVSAGQSYAPLSFEQAATDHLEARHGRVSGRRLQFEKERLVPLKKHFARKTLARVTADHIEAYREARVRRWVSCRTANIEVGVLRWMLKKAKRWR